VLESDKKFMSGFEKTREPVVMSKIFALKDLEKKCINCYQDVQEQLERSGGIRRVKVTSEKRTVFRGIQHLTKELNVEEHSREVGSNVYAEIALYPKGYFVNNKDSVKIKTTTLGKDASDGKEMAKISVSVLGTEQCDGLRGYLKENGYEVESESAIETPAAVSEV